MRLASWKRFVSTSVGKKQVVGITGLGISAFILVHMAENLLLIVGPRAYNSYANFLVTNPLLPLAEIILLIFFLTHICFTIQLTIENRRARPVGYYRSPNAAGKQASFAAKTMILSGLLLLTFLILHLITFKWGTYYEIQYGGPPMRDLYRLVAEKFRQPLYVAWYELCMILVGLHLSHGFSATFQSLGFSSVRKPALKKMGWAFALVVAAGFISEPLFFILGGGK